MGNEFKPCNLKVSVVVAMLNQKFKAICARPIVLKQGTLRYGESKFDTAKGRYVVSMSNLKDSLTSIIGTSYHITTDRWEVSIYGTALRLKAKRKKSGFTKYPDTDILTIVEVELLNPAIADMTVHDVYLMARTQSNQAQVLIEKEALDFKQALELELKKYNMPLSVFITLQQSVEKAPYSNRTKLGI